MRSVVETMTTVTNFIQVGDHVVVRDSVIDDDGEFEVWVLGEVTDVDEEGGFTYDVLDHSGVPAGTVSEDDWDSGALFGDEVASEVISAHSVPVYTVS